ncbi:MAG: nicotinamide-nucleotide amidohydrolase family protein [Anaerolineae bacterium]|nr:nicotinamide-nucleotide amidohydrolase family protein [Anaerolineae bacterium]
MEPTLEAQVGARLTARGWTVCAAESCTGGLVMHRLTNIAGSSGYVLGGVVTYSNEAKQKLIGVREATLVAHGAVSEQTAAEMVEGVRALFDADIAVSITGIAGPGGGTPEKPVGLTYIGLKVRGQPPQVQRHMWAGDRVTIKEASASAALGWMLETLEALPERP